MLIESNEKFKSYLLNDFDSDHEELLSYNTASNQIPKPPKQPK